MPSLTRADLSAVIIARFWFSVARSPEPDGCWLWTGATNDKGYGQLRVGRRVVYAHQIAYVLAHGAIPDGLEPDHTCHTRACVRASHLEAVTHAENMRRTEAALRDTCAAGHPFTPENTYRVTRADGRDGRECRACRAARRR